jgi:transposase-like protein
MSRPRKCPEELLERGVRLALESGRPIAHAAAELGIHSETLRKRCVNRPQVTVPSAFVRDVLVWSPWQPGWRLRWR